MTGLRSCIRHQVPDDSGPLSRFLVGTATSAFQVEGARDVDGRGASIWDAPRWAAGAERGCDHYHRWPEDLDLLSALGVNAYRFSVAWPRVQPTGRGPSNRAGLDFYARLIDGLRNRGITPIICLYHWDLPQALQDAGGWHNRDTAQHFAQYAELVAREFGDVVDVWATMNEPVVHIFRGHVVGAHAPGLMLDDWPRVAHHLLLGHGHAVRAIRDAAPRAAVGLIENLSPVRTVGAEAEDRTAAALCDAVRNRLILGPVLAGEYPKLLRERYPEFDAVARDGDMAAIGAPLDFVGVNYYGPTGAQAPVEGSPLPWTRCPLPGLPTTAAGNIVEAAGLRETLTTLRDRYGGALPPVIVTEFGRDADDVLDEAGRCDDHDRVAFLSAHGDALAAAIDAGVDVRGAFVWSLLDNFEWSEGFGPRYGLVHVDFASGKRTPKRSFEWLAEQLREPAELRG